MIDPDEVGLRAHRDTRGATNCYLLDWPMARTPEPPEEGPAAANRFKTLLGRVLTVSKDELKRREAEYKRSRAEKQESPKPPTRTTTP